MFLNDSTEGFTECLFDIIGKNLVSSSDLEGMNRTYYFVIDNETSKKVKELLINEMCFEPHLIDVEGKNSNYEIDGLSYFILEDKYYKRRHEITSKILNKKDIWAEIFGCIRERRIPVCIYDDYRGEIKLQHLYGVGNKDSKGKEGWRDDLQTVFMSSWEANIARILNFRNIGWGYEQYSVELKSHSGNKKESSGNEYNYNYTPDFTLNDGSIIEVKGSWDSNSVNVAYCFFQEYPNLKMYHIDSDMYVTLERLYSPVIQNWEYSSTHSIKSNDLPLIGITQPDRIAHIKRLTEPEFVFLERDRDNPYDKNAIKVVNSSDNHLGFIAKQQAAIYAPKMDLGMKFRANVKQIQEKVITLKVKRYDDKDIVHDIFKLPK